MPWPTYSERFLHAAGASTTQNVTVDVPAGRRWVVKTVMGSSGTPTASWYILYIHGHELLRFVFPAPATYNAASVMCVGYAGETVKITLGGVDTRVTLFGYSFTDPVERELAPIGTDDQQPIDPDWHLEVRGG